MKRRNGLLYSKTRTPIRHRKKGLNVLFAVMLLLAFMAQPTFVWASSFADAVVSYTLGDPSDDPFATYASIPQGVIGEPDWDINLERIPDPSDPYDQAYVNLGYGGEIIVTMDSWIEDGDGYDLIVYEIGKCEDVYAFVSNDLQTWIALGKANSMVCTDINNKFYYEFSGKVSGSVKYVKLVDAESVEKKHHGADIDAVEGLHPVSFSVEPAFGKAPLDVEVSCEPTGLNGTVVAYEFHPGDGSIFLTSNYSTFNYTYYNPGSYNPTCTIYDDEGKNVTLGPIVINVAPLLSTFDAHTEGWTNIEDATVTWQPTEGNPGGFLQGNDDAVGNVYFFVSPSSWSGDWSSYINGTLSFDLKLIWTDGGPYFDRYDNGNGDDVPEVVIYGKNGSKMSWNYNHYPMVGNWFHYALKLEPSSFNVDEETFNEIMSNVSSLQIRGEYISGDETGGLDNVMIVSPMPTVSTNRTYYTIPFDYNANMASAAHFSTKLLNGDKYPTGNLILKGIPFYIPTSGNNFWNSHYAGGPNPRTLSIDVNIYGVTEVHTLMNTFWGQPGPNSYAYIIFYGSEGAEYRVDLIGNHHIRDYNECIWTNSIDSPNTVEVFRYYYGIIDNEGCSEWQRLDKQVFYLPEEFKHQTLTNILLVDNGAGPENLPDLQRIFIAGLTVGVPNYQINVQVTPEDGTGGVVTSNTKDISCPDNCSHNYEAGANVTLTTEPAEGFTFSGWDGDCAECGNDTDCTITMDADKSCSAVFEEIPNQPPVIDSFTVEPSFGSAPLTVAVICQATDPDGNIASYEFNPGDGSAPITSDNGTFSYTYDTPGSYNATCTAYDNDEASVTSEPVTVTVEEAGPSWNDITEGISYTRSRTLYDRINRAFFVLLDVTNDSDADIAGPVRMVLESSSLDLKSGCPGLEPDDYTDDGKPYFIIVPEGETWAAGETLEDLRLNFVLQRKRLTFELRFEEYGQ